MEDWAEFFGAVLGVIGGVWLFLRCKCPLCHPQPQHEETGQ